MKCEDVNSNLSKLPKGELTYEKRQVILDHLQSCKECNEEYQQYLRMFYLIDKQPKITIPANILESFSKEVAEKIEEKEPNIFQFRRFVWYVAAAILLVILALNPFWQTENQNKNLRDVSITELIEKEDWETVIQKFSKNELPEELISISLLLSKLSDIDIELANHTLIAKFGKNTDEFNKLVQLLIEYQKFTDNISINEISKYLKTKTGAAS